MSSTKSERSLRIAAIEILSFLSKFGSPPQTNATGPTENRYLGTSEAEVRAAAKKIVDDDSDRSHLRAMCVHLLRVADPEIIGDLKHVHSRTSSSELRFAIEDAFLDISDDVYLSLNPQGGPIASIVQLSSNDSCGKAPTGKLAFIANVHEDQGYATAFGAVALASRPERGAIQQQVKFVLTNADTGERVLVKEARFFRDWHKNRRSAY